MADLFFAVDAFTSAIGAELENQVKNDYFNFEIN